MSAKQNWKRTWKDYSEIVLDVRTAAKLHIVAESALRIANAEKAIVRFNFNGVDLAVASSDDTLKSIILAYNDRLKAQDEASTDTGEAEDKEQ